MTDIPGDRSTTAELVLNGPGLTSHTDFGDRDWIRVSLLAGEGYTFSLTGEGSQPLTNPDLVLRDASGAVVARGNGDALRDDLEFFPAESGIYYLDVGGAYSFGTGNYTVSGTSRAALPIYTNEQIAEYLTDGYWTTTGGGRHAFAGSTISYDIDGLTAEGQALAVAALRVWSAVSGLSFVEAADGAQITFHDDIPFAFSTYSATDGVTTQANVNIGTEWLRNYGTAINSYSFQTYIHEIGHALGLGHAGNYNFSGTWSAYGGGQNHYLNDSWQATVMSYFHQDQNTYVDASLTFVVSPMMADIVAIQDLYGLPVTANAGDTTYGRNANAVGYFDFGFQGYPGMPAYTIYDPGGIDTLDLTQYNNDQRIDLRSGHYSDYDYRIGNLGIAENTVIENAITGWGNDRLTGNAAANRLDGGAGADVMVGGAGDDTYRLDQDGDVIVEAIGEGSDRILTAIAYALAEGQEIETLELADAAATTALDLAGNEFANTLRGNAGANRLDGSGGGDSLHGLGGDDLYLVDDASDRVFEAAGGGLDRVVASASFVLAAGQHVETVSVSEQMPYEAIDLAGNEFANTLVGNWGSNVLNGRGGADEMRGLDGNDVYFVDHAGDQVIETAFQGADRINTTISYVLSDEQGIETLALALITGASALNLTGNAFANRLVGNDGDNILIGNAGDDILDGGLGNDRMEGGDGDDTYRVDAATDVVSESGTGRDTVSSSISFTLAAQIERLYLTGSASIDGTGNASANAISGNAGDNTLIGYGGDDILNGGLGADTMRGGAGDDIYYVESAADQVLESGIGRDTVFSSVAMTLATHVERLHLLGSDSIKGAGNALANTIVGNAGDNILIGNDGNDVLDGGLGADTMKGGDGNDTYLVDSATDLALDSGIGFDTAFSSVTTTLTAHVERLYLTGPAAIDGTGNALANRIVGNEAANVIDGKSGDDVLTGGLGADGFAFTTALSAAARDRITDFGQGADRILLDDAVFTALGRGALAASAFKDLAAGPADADDRLLYDSAAGILFYDANGSGAGQRVRLAVLDNEAALTAADFVVM